MVPNNGKQFVDDQQRTALMIAALNGNDQEIRSLVASGAHLEARDADGNTALIYAAKRGQSQTVKMLLEELGANLNVANDFGDTPLICAAYFGHSSCVDILAKHGSKIEAPNHEGDTALMSAVNRKHWQTVNTLVKLGSAIVCPFNLEEKNIYGDTALLYAIKNQQWGNVQALIELGSNMHVGDRYGYTPEMLLANIKDTSVLEANGINIKVEDRNRAKMEYDKLTNLIKVIKEAGHVLGFTRRILGIEPTHMFNKKAGYDLLNSFLENLPSELYSSTLHQHYTPPNSIIREALDRSEKYLIKSNIDIHHKSIIRDHQAGKLVILPVSWPGHAITLIAWNDLLIVCNRGENKLEQGVSVFKIPNGNLTEAFLQSVMPQNEPSAPQVLKGISAHVDVRNPILSFPTQDQKYSNCGFVNLKSSLQPILCFIKFLEFKRIHEGVAPDLNSTLLEPLTHNGHAIDPLLKQCMEEAKKEYKFFTEFMRDRKVMELCKTFENLPKDAYKERKVYFEILTAYLHEHHGQAENIKGQLRPSEKVNAERKRASWILQSISKVNHEQASPLVTPGYDMTVERAKPIDPLVHKDSNVSSLPHPK